MREQDKRIGISLLRGGTTANGEYTSRETQGESYAFILMREFNRDLQPRLDSVEYALMGFQSCQLTLFAPAQRLNHGDDLRVVRPMRGACSMV